VEHERKFFILRRRGLEEDLTVDDGSPCLATELKGDIGWHGDAHRAKSNREREPLNPTILRADIRHKGQDGRVASGGLEPGCALERVRSRHEASITRVLILCVTRPKRDTPTLTRGGPSRVARQAKTAVSAWNRIEPEGNPSPDIR
jgi:hypothetical protein